jgi:hypothetical protein
MQFLIIIIIIDDATFWLLVLRRRRRFFSRSYLSIHPSSYRTTIQSTRKLAYDTAKRGK